MAKVGAVVLIGRSDLLRDLVLDRLTHEHFIHSEVRSKGRGLIIAVEPKAEGGVKILPPMIGRPEIMNTETALKYMLRWWDFKDRLHEVTLGDLWGEEALFVDGGGVTLKQLEERLMN